MLICIYESRADCEPGVRLLIATLAAYAPGQPVRLHFNPADDGFARWIADFSDVDFRPAALPPELHWNVKPRVLLDAFDDGHDQLLWLDSDLLVARDFRARFAAIPDGTVILAEEALWGGHDDGDAMRTRAWRMEVGRALPFACNSAILRVSARHRPLVEAWAALLETPDYKAAQAHRAADRPIHMVGDQDVLTALMCSRRFADVGLHLLRRGTGVLQLFGLKAFTLRERAIVLARGVPPFVHAQGVKPWKEGTASARSARFDRLRTVYADASPYIMIARRFRRALVDRSWLAPRSAGGRILRAAGFGSVALSGLPLALLMELMFAGAGLAKAVKRRRAG